MPIKQTTKGTTSIAIGLLVLLVLILTTTALFYTLTKQKQIDEQIASGSSIENLYKEKAEFNFYLRNIVEQSAKSANTKEEFIENMKKNIEKYVAEGKYINEFNQIINQLENAEIIFSDEKSITFEISITSKDDIEATHTYTKTFTS